MRGVGEGLPTGRVAMEKHYRWSIKSWKYSQAIILLSGRTEGTELQWHLRTCVHYSVAHSSQMVEQLKYPMWMNTAHALQTHNGYCYSVLKREKEILLHARIWMSLKDVILNEIIQWQKGKCCKILLTQIFERRHKVEQWLPEAIESGGGVFALKMGRYYGLVT